MSNENSDGLVTSRQDESKSMQQKDTANATLLPASSVGLTLDQNQLMQITQLMNEINQQQPSSGHNSNDSSLTEQSHPPQLVEFIVGASPLSTTYANNNNNNNQQQQQNSHHQQLHYVTEMDQSKHQHSIITSTQQINDINVLHQQQQHQQNEDQIHTIMLNGQPALFIPASAAMNSGMLCQMIMNSTNPTMMMQQSQSGDQSNSHQSLGQSFDVIQVPGDGSFSISQQSSDNQHHQQFISVNNLGTGTVAMSGDQTQPMQYIQVSNGGSQQQVFIDSNQAQQIVYVNQDGHIIQPFQTQHQNQQQSFGQHHQQQDNQQQLHDEQDKKDESLTSSKVIDESPQRKIKKKGPTVAAVLANASNSPNNSPTKIMPATPKTPNKVANLLNEKKQRQEQEQYQIQQQQQQNFIFQQQQQQQQQHQQQIQFHTQSQHQQLIFLNTTNTVPTCSSMPIIISSLDQLKSNGLSLTPISELTTRNESDDPNGDPSKKRRRACDCPNCVRWKQNIVTSDELLKKRTHKCHKCSKEYNKTSHLRAHLRGHDGYRPYVCDFKSCLKSFTRSDELKRHKRIHNDDRNFVCSVCKKKFLRSDHLSKHFLVHNKPQSTSLASNANGSDKADKSNSKSKPVENLSSSASTSSTLSTSDANNLSPASTGGDNKVAELISA